MAIEGSYMCFNFNDLEFLKVLQSCSEIKRDQGVSKVHSNIDLS